MSLEYVYIRLKGRAKVVPFAYKSSEISLKRNDIVIVESKIGTTYGKVSCAGCCGGGQDEERVKKYKRVLRIANGQDLKKIEKLNSIEEEASRFCKEEIRASDINMKLVDVESSLNGKKLAFFFISEQRVDFRELVKKMASKFRTRIEMVQIGVRDQAKILSGCGPCGGTICCNSFIDRFEPVTIKMVKAQKVALNPGKISGVCGRLMCCLAFEYNPTDPSAREMRSCNGHAEEEAILEVLVGTEQEILAVDGIDNGSGMLAHEGEGEHDDAVVTDNGDVADDSVKNRNTGLQGHRAPSRPGEYSRETRERSRDNRPSSYAEGRDKTPQTAAGAGAENAAGNPEGQRPRYQEGRGQYNNRRNSNRNERPARTEANDRQPGAPGANRNPERRPDRGPENRQENRPDSVRQDNRPDNRPDNRQANQRDRGQQRDSNRGRDQQQPRTAENSGRGQQAGERRPERTSGAPGDNRREQNRGGERRDNRPREQNREPNRGERRPDHSRGGRRQEAGQQQAQPQQQTPGTDTRPERTERPEPSGNR